jgi:hemerythrin-like domain-containing protein
MASASESRSAVHHCALGPSVLLALLARKYFLGGHISVKPGQRTFAAMKITEALLAEHLVFHSMFDHIEAAAPKLKTLGEIKALAAVMEDMLKQHAHTEDELFLGPLEHCFEQMGQRDAFLAEHQEMDGNLQRVRKAGRLKTARELLLAAVRHSRQHFDREERIVFPLAENVLKERTLIELGQSWMDQRTRAAASALPV